MNLPVTRRTERRSSVLLVALATLASPGCDGGGSAPPEEDGTTTAAAGTPWFEECARERGLAFDHVSGHDGEYLFPEIVCGGVALVDLNGDAALDAYLVQSGHLQPGAPENPPNRLFTNDGTGHFTDATEGSGAEDRSYGIGVAAGDVDDDGDTDLYVNNVGPNVLLVNDGAARFTDTTAAAGCGDPSWSVSSAFFDMENDGDLDLFVVNYVVWSLADELLCEQPPIGPDYCSPKAYRAPAPDVLYENTGDGRFRDVSSPAGIRTTFGNGLGVVCIDPDDDGWTDVFVANDGTINQLWMNRRDGTFEDEALLRGCGVDQDGLAKAGMGVSAADVDEDGDEDLLVVNLGPQSDSFYLNEGARFSDRTGVAGLATISRPFTRFGCALVDFDQDGHVDLYLANGRVSRNADAPAGLDDPYAEPNLLLRRTPEGLFEEVLPRGGCATPHVETSRGAAFGDVDGDGAIDVLVANRDGPARLYRNVAPKRGAAARLRVLDANGRDAFGAVVTARIGERTLRATVRSAYSYAAASDPAVHVGLGDASGIDALEVRWVDGSTEAFPGCGTGTTVLRRGASDEAR